MYGAIKIDRWYSLFQLDIFASVEEEEKSKEDDKEQEDTDDYGYGSGSVVGTFSLDAGSLGFCNGIFRKQ